MRLLLAFSLIIALASCEHSKLLKSPDMEYKYQETIKLYDEGKYLKAYPLIEELYTYYRGHQRGEELYYIYAYSDYYLQDYLLAAHRFSQFAETFPTSKHVEECVFMSAYCNYLMSPDSDLDQTETVKALSELQGFIEKYPMSPKRDTCTMYINELETKLELKAYNAAYQYYKIMDYNACVVAMENVLVSYPDTDFREDVYYTIFLSKYELAVGSVVEKKQERIKKAKKSYQDFIDRYPQSDKLKSAENMFNHLLSSEEALLKKEEKK